MKPMYFKLYHNPENKTLTIPRAALQLSGLADAEELILHTGGGYVLAARNALSTARHIRRWDSSVLTSASQAPLKNWTTKERCWYSPQIP